MVILPTFSQQPVHIQMSTVVFWVLVRCVKEIGFPELLASHVRGTLFSLPLLIILVSFALVLKYPIPVAKLVLPINILIHLPIIV